MPVRFIEKVMTLNQNFLAKSYSALVKAEKSHDDKGNLPYKPLVSSRKIEDNEKLKKGRYWTEVTSELDYARDKARRHERECG
jgi:TRIAD3 protein (E3 ubiquitin-protein ligase RNF216)